MPSLTGPLTRPAATTSHVKRTSQRQEGGYTWRPVILQTSRAFSKFGCQRMHVKKKSREETSRKSSLRRPSSWGLYFASAVKLGFTLCGWRQEGVVKRKSTDQTASGTSRGNVKTHEFAKRKNQQDELTTRGKSREKVERDLHSRFVMFHME